jgi:hypothetical protein
MLSGPEFWFHTPSAERRGERTWTLVGLPSA